MKPKDNYIDWDEATVKRAWENMTEEVRKPWKSADELWKDLRNSVWLVVGDKVRVYYDKNDQPIMPDWGEIGY